MAFSNFLYLTDQTAGAPRNSGTNGDLNTLLNWALVTTHGGWVREYHNAGTNESIFRPNTGNRHRLYVRHDNSASGGSNYAVVRGCENASSASTLIDPFPTVSQLANNTARWQTSTTANTTSRPFKILVWESGIVYFSQLNGFSSYYRYGAFFDTPSIYNTDIYNTICITNHTSSNAFSNTATSTALAAYGQSMYFARDISGTIKSTYASLNATGTFMGINNVVAMKGAPYNKIMREPVGINCIGSNTTTPGTNAISIRGYFPNMWNPVHNYTNELQNIILTDPAYNPSASFLVTSVISGATVFSNMIIETTNTWNIPDINE